MALTNEQIKSILIKDVTSKTILVDPESIDKIVDNHLKDGWTLYKQSVLNKKVKLTFIKKE